MTDPAHLQAALERLRQETAFVAGSNVAFGYYKQLADDVTLLLTSHAALLARAEAAEAALREANAAIAASNSAMERTIASQERMLSMLAAHPQPQAPVMGGEGADGPHA